MIRFLSGSLFLLCLMLQGCGGGEHTPEPPPEKAPKSLPPAESDPIPMGKVLAESGLSVREYPMMKAPKLGVLPRDTMVELRFALGPVEKIEGIRAHWVEIKYGEQKGWVFGGFLESKQRRLSYPNEKCAPADVTVWLAETKDEHRLGEQWLVKGVLGPQTMELPCLWDLRKLEIFNPWGVGISESGKYLAVTSGTSVTGVLALFEKETLKKLDSFSLATDPEDNWGFEGDVLYLHQPTDSVLQKKDGGPTQYATRKFRWEEGKLKPTEEYGTQWLD